MLLPDVPDVMMRFAIAATIPMSAEALIEAVALLPAKHSRFRTAE
jgi:hypothetical protein